jgi:hypothetical protein
VARQGLAWRRQAATHAYTSTQPRCQRAPSGRRDVVVDVVRVIQGRRARDHRLPAEACVAPPPQAHRHTPTTAPGAADAKRGTDARAVVRSPASRVHWRRAATRSEPSSRRQPAAQCTRPRRTSESVQGPRRLAVVRPRPVQAGDEALRVRVPATADGPSRLRSAPIGGRRAVAERASRAPGSRPPPAGSRSRKRACGGAGARRRARHAGVGEALRAAASELSTDGTHLWLRGPPPRVVAAAWR